ncbi:MAG TPA: hypothetical protein PK156_21450 [Polyangium sp.]|nr:hypothetical protein [Polyangium sp.]
MLQSKQSEQKGTNMMHTRGRIQAWHVLVVLWSVAAVMTAGCSGVIIVEGDDSGSPTDRGSCAPASSRACSFGGPSDTLGVGICVAATQTCNAAGTEWSECIGEVLPQSEDCNTIVDDDCDGLVNEDCECTEGETISCYSASPGTIGVGICAAGQQTCMNGVFGPCIGEVTPRPETCATPDIDENCDGLLQCVSEQKRGLTWVKWADDSCGQNRVTCDSSCDPYIGDTLCTEARPILCLRLDNSSNCGEPSDFYDGWTSGTMALTPRLVLGTELTSPQAADAICENEVGPGFRMAEHHDGNGGWGWRAKGIIDPPATPPMTHPRFDMPNQPNRFWVRINDQPGNCWD